MARFNQLFDFAGGIIKTMVLRDDGIFVLTDPNASDADATELKAWLAAGNTLGAPIKPPAAVAEDTRQQSFKDDVDRTAMVTRLRASNSAQVDTWVTNNVTTLADARKVIGIILKLLSINGR